MKKLFISLCCSALFYGANAQTNLEEGLVASYKFNGNANDHVGNIDGIVNGAVLTEDRFGNPDKAYLFDGNDDFINLGDTTAFEFDSAFTISTWVRNDGPGSGVTRGHGIIINREGEYEFATINNNNIEYALSTTTRNSWEWNQNTGVAVTASTWEHIAFTYGQDSLKIYINGEKVGSYYETGYIDEQASNTNSQDDFQIGSRQAFPGESNFNGAMDDFRIYGVDLNEEAIKEIYELESVDPYYFGNPVAAYDFSGNAEDIIGDIDGTVEGAVLTEDRHGNPASAYLFDGQDDYINLGDTNAFEFDTAFSIAIWIRNDGSGSGDLRGHGIIINREGEYEFATIDNNVFEYALSTTTRNSWWWNQNTGISVTASTWEHMVFTYGQDSLKVYINGEKVASYYETGNIDEQAAASFNQDDFRIGGREANTANANFNGAMDDLKIYGTVIDADLVKEIYDAEKPDDVLEIVEFTSHKFNVFPNPTSHTVTVNRNDISTIEVLSMTGESLFTTSTNTVNCEFLTSGVYFLNITTLSGDQETVRIIKQ